MKKTKIEESITQNKIPPKILKNQNSLNTIIYINI